MGKFRIIGMAFVAVFALSAIVASAAQAAAPEFGRCAKTAKVEKKYIGKYLNAGCTEEATKNQQKKGKENKYEWSPGPGANNGFTSEKEAGSEETTLETASGSIVACTNETSTGGKYVAGGNNKQVTGVTATFTGCKEETADTKCNSAGAAAGEIVTTALEGELSIITTGATAAENKIGLDLYPPGKTGSVAEFACFGGLVTVRMTGSVIHEVKTNSMQLTPKETFKCKAPGKQIPEKDEGQENDILETTFEGLISQGPEQSCQRLKAIVTNQEEIEVNPVV